MWNSLSPRQRSYLCSRFYTSSYVLSCVSLYALSLNAIYSSFGHPQINVVLEKQKTQPRNLVRRPMDVYMASHSHISHTHAY
jgi:hypothetical protein